MSNGFSNIEGFFSDGDCFHSAVVTYLENECRYIDEDIHAHESMSDGEKESAGLLIRNATRIDGPEKDSVRYETPVNFTKLRPGDEVRILEPGTESDGRKVVVDENAIGEISFTASCQNCVRGKFPEVVDIVVNEENNLDVLKSVVEDIKDGNRGVKFMEILGGLGKPRMEARFGMITDFDDSEIPPSFNEKQRMAVRMAMRRPSVAYVQGTPGSGKTHLLSVVARGYARRSKDVVVLALTHQAVNNALNKVRKADKDIPVVKVGRLFKNHDLDDGVVQSETFYGYLSERKNGGDFYGGAGHVVGMTFQAALVNLGKSRSPFIPQIILFDEAGQVPLAHAVAVGAFGCGSVVFIGDDAQMPPIFHEKLHRDALSVSVFEHVKRLYPDNGVVLDVTYRMNKTISDFVGTNFYLPRDIKLSCSPESADRIIENQSIEFVGCSSPGATDENGIEAAMAVKTVAKYIEMGISYDRIAVITPYRRQVRLVHRLLSDAWPKTEKQPLIDTVERLQGQDVDVIVLTFATDDEKFFNVQKSFLLNLNRLNVMFSRATSKVVVIASQIVLDGLSSIVGFKEFV